MNLFSNNGSSLLAVGILAGDLSLQVTATEGDLFPLPAGTQVFYITVENAAGAYEIMKVTARVGDQMTIVRAQEGTTALAFTAGARVELRTTKGVLDAFIQRDGDIIDGGTY